MVDPIFSSDIYQLAGKLMDASALRQDAIASNLANAETPGYHRMDVAPDFATQLRAACENGTLATDAESLKPALVEDHNARAVRPDGNNVEIQRELLAMDQSSVEYDYLTNLVTSNIKELKMAISGQVTAS
jgi:flagellar basal-body rod protein FlgB